MTSATKITLGLILLGGIGTLIFIKVKQAKDEAKAKGGSAGSTGSNTPTPSGQVASPAPATAPVTPAAPVAPPTPPDPRIGKTATAKYDQTAVYNADNSPYKTASKGEWIGTVSSVSNGKIFVEGNSRYVWDTTTPSVNTNFSGPKK